MMLPGAGDVWGWICLGMGMSGNVYYLAGVVVAGVCVAGVAGVAGVYVAGEEGEE